MLTAGLADAHADMRDWLAAHSVVPLSYLDVAVEAIPADAQLADRLCCPTAPLCYGSTGASTPMRTS